MKKSMVAVAVACARSVKALIGSLPGARSESADAFEKSALREPEVPSIGNPQGDVTIVEYFDYQCPYCRKAAPELRKIAKEDGKLRIVMRDWPIFGGDSQYAAKMVFAGTYQNKYHAAHGALINARTKLSEDVIQKLLREAGIDVDRAKRDLETYNSAIETLLARNYAQAEASGFGGTPAFIIGRIRVPGAMNPAGFKQVIADARAAALTK